MANQGDFASGAVLTAADLNAFSKVTVLNAASVSVINMTSVRPAFPSEVIDVGDWHSNSTNNNRITVDSDGVYLITYNVVGLNSSGARGLIDLYRNAVKIASTDNDTGALDLSVTAHDLATAGDFYEAVLWQNSGSTQTPSVTFSVQLVRAT
jgi:hypothetical protein